MTPEEKERKKFYVEYEFPELPGGKMRQSWHGEATNLGMAAFQAFKEIRKRAGIKGRRIHRAKLSVVEMTTPGESS